MINDIFELLKLREERVEALGRTFIVRELTAGASLGDPIDAKDPESNLLGYWRMIVRCVLDEQGARIFQDDDIAELRKGSRQKLAPLLAAVDRVNGIADEENAKN